MYVQLAGPASTVIAPVYIFNKKINLYNKHDQSG